MGGSLIRDRQIIEEIDVNGLMLGVCKNIQYDMFSTYLNPQDVMTLATDGITEARKSSEFLGMKGYRRIVSAATKINTDDLSELILAKAKHFAGTLQDDACVMVLQAK